MVLLVVSMFSHDVFIISDIVNVSEKQIYFRSSIVVAVVVVVVSFFPYVSPRCSLAFLLLPYA